MAVNLLRNARLFFTTNVDTTTGKIKGDTACSNTNTFEVQVLDSLSFSQNTTQETVQLNEAGATPNRGQVSFNTALEPVDFSFSTYIRPNVTDAGTDFVTCEEKYFWNAMFGDEDHTTTGSAWNDVASATATPSLTTANSEVHQFQKFGLIVVMDKEAFLIDNCAIDQAVIDFGLDAISTIAWTGRGTTIRHVEGISVGAYSTEGADVAFTGGTTSSITGAAKGPYRNAKYLTNKLSTLVLKEDIGGTAVSYDVAITGGSLTFANNINYLTPANLGVVNTPVTYYSGTRAISGTLNAYLRSTSTGNGSTAELLNKMLTGAASTIQPEFNMTLHIGGSASATVRVTVDMPAVMLTIPSVNVEQIVSTAINFTAMGSKSSAFDVEEANEMTIKYHHPTVA